MKISLSDQELKRISRYSFIGLVIISLAYVVLINSYLSSYTAYVFFLIYGVFVFSTTVLDRRKKLQATLNESGSKEIYRTLRGAFLLLMGIFGLLLAGAFLFNLL